MCVCLCMIILISNITLQIIMYNARRPGYFSQLLFRNIFLKVGSSVSEMLVILVQDGRHDLLVSTSST